MVITGDLSFSSTNWGTMESTDFSESLFLDKLVDLGFQQKLHECAGTSLDVFFIGSEVKHITSRICLELEKLLYDKGMEKFSDHVPYLSSIVVEYEPVQAVSWNSRSFSNVDWEFVNTVVPEKPLTHFCSSNPNVLLSERYLWINRIMDRTIPVNLNTEDLCRHGCHLKRPTDWDGITLCWKSSSKRKLISLTKHPAL